MTNVIPHDMEGGATFDPLIHGLHFTIRHQTVRIPEYDSAYSRI